MPPREEILSTLEQALETLFARYRSLTPEELEISCTESEAPDSSPWRPKDHLAHLAFIERSFQRIIQRMLRGKSDPVGFTSIGTGSRPEVLAWIHDNNQKNIEAHQNDDIETLLTDLLSARRDTLALLDQLTDSQLNEQVPGAPWGGGSIGGILVTNAHHERLHLGWIEEGLHQHQGT